MTATRAADSISSVHKTVTFSAGNRPSRLTTLPPTTTVSTERVSLTSGGTSNVLQRLTAAGHVDREANAADARGRWVRLTAQGQALTDKAMAISVRVHEDLLAGIPTAAIRAAADALREITAATDRRH